jgi:hypothetical protein
VAVRFSGWYGGFEKKEKRSDAVVAGCFIVNLEGSQ